MDKQSLFSDKNKFFDKNKIDELLTRGVEKIYPSKEELEKVLRSGKKLRVYQGFDPTGIQLHIGHMIGLKKLKQWQDLGHEVIFLIGDLTGTIGDPTGRDKTRPLLTREQVLENAKTYKKQASKILRFHGDNPVKVKYNSEWLAKMPALELARLSHYLSVQQLMKRDLFRRRLKSDMDIAMNEFLYPLLQAYDSVFMDVDVEVGGSDQLFNMMVGRDLMHKMKRKNKFVMTTPLLTDVQGTKIGKTEGNVIGITDEPNELFGKIMALPDEVITKAFECLTDVPREEVNEIAKSIEKNENPLAHKKRLAFEIVKQLNDENSARVAQENFERTVQRQELSTEIPIYQYIGSEEENIIDLLLQTKLVASRSEAKRLVEQGGVEIDSKEIRNPKSEIRIKNGMIIKVGKRKFLKLEI